MAPGYRTKCAFTLAHYDECLKRALDNGYGIFRLSDYDKTRPVTRAILLRHDEDISLKSAHEMAVIEQKRNICATYFIRLHARFYNALSLESYSLLREIVAMGHEIGLHYELHSHSVLEGMADELFRHEKALLSALVGTDIVGISCHEPSRTLAGAKPLRAANLGVQYIADDPEFTDGFKYISDSSAHWREGCMCEHIGRTDRLYILTHGFWWFHESPVESY